MVKSICKIQLVSWFISLCSSSLLGSVGNPRVNYFSLDIEGAEFQVRRGGASGLHHKIYQVLQTIPWDQVDIEVGTFK